MTAPESARTALATAGILAAADRQVDQVVARAALALAAGEPQPFQTAAEQVAQESR